MKKSDFIRLDLYSREEFLKYYIVAKHTGLHAADLLECLFRERGGNYINFAINIGAVEEN